MTRIIKIMDKDVLTLGKNNTLSDAIRLLVKKPKGCIIVVENKKPVGIVTDADILRAHASRNFSMKKKIFEIMTSHVTTINSSTKLEKASKIIDSKHFRRYPIVDKDNEVIGLITENDVVQTINKNISFHRNLQNLVLIAFVMFEFFVFVLYQRIVNFFNF